MLNTHFTKQQLNDILDQSLLYQCACPAQLARQLFTLRELHKYQQDCTNETDTDVLVHRRIADDAEKAHAIFEQCMLEVLKMEGWDMTTLKIPEGLQKKMRDI